MVLQSMGLSIMDLENRYLKSGSSIIGSSNNGSVNSRYSNDGSLNNGSYDGSPNDRS